MPNMDRKLTIIQRDEATNVAIVQLLPEVTVSVMTETIAQEIALQMVVARMFSYLLRVHSMADILLGHLAPQLIPA